MASISRIHKSLDRLAEKSKILDLNLESDKYVIFSDHHRGIGDGADDFVPCKENYITALENYYNSGFGLILLGDVEEFWENTLKSVLSKYGDILHLEKKFHERGKLIKIWGNHDDAWNRVNEVSQYLFPFFSNIATYEALNLNIISEKNTRLGTILLVHGHQGSGASDRFAGISRWFVRVIWRNIQRWFKIPLSTPAKSKLLKDSHDIAMHDWAKSKSKQIVVCGHTHQPVFMSRNHLDVLEAQLEGLDNKIDSDRILEIKRKISELSKKTTPIGTLVADAKPCYFNSGCCSFADGDITGLELSNGTISLVKWSKSKRITIVKEEVEEIYNLL